MSLIDDLEKPRNKTEYYKDKWTTLTFQLKDLEEYEDYKIFDTYATESNKKWLTTGVEVEADDGTKKKIFKVEDTKFIPQTAFNVLFKGKRRTTVYNRNIIIDNKEYRFGFKKSANDSLKQMITNIKQMGNNPLEVLFKMSKVGEGIKTEYKVEIAGKTSIVKDAKPSTQINLNNIMVPKPLTQQEQSLINALRLQPQEAQTAEAIMEVAEGNNIPMTNERAKELEKYF